MDKVGDFYEASGIDACILVEYVGLNPFGGFRSDSIPRAGCRVMNLRQTLDDQTQNGYSVCIVEEVQGPAQAQSRDVNLYLGPGRYELDFEDYHTYSVLSNNHQIVYVNFNLLIKTQLFIGMSNLATSCLMVNLDLAIVVIPNLIFFSIKQKDSVSNEHDFFY